METNKLLLEAIALRKCVEATYNRTRVKLAPHVLYTRHDDLFVDAVTIERDGMPPREIKIGSFKLAGLVDLNLVDETFTLDPIVNFDEPRYDGTIVFAVEVN